MKISCIVVRTAVQTAINGKEIGEKRRESSENYTEELANYANY